MAEIERTKLEKYLKARLLRFNSPCACMTDPVIVMRHSTYLGCPKCGQSISVQLTPEETKLVQSGDLV